MPALDPFLEAGSLLINIHDDDVTDLLLFMSLTSCFKWRVMVVFINASYRR